VHVDEYWGKLEEEDAEKAKAHFSKWQACLDKAKAESIPDLFEKVLASIRKDASRKKSTKKTEKPKRNGDKITSGNKTWLSKKRLSKAQKRANATERINNAAQKLREENN